MAQSLLSNSENREYFDMILTGQYHFLLTKHNKVGVMGANLKTTTNNHW